MVGFVQYSLIEPMDAVDKGMYVTEGLLPEILIHEGEEPADILLLWGKEAAFKHHPIVRQKKYWELLDKLCMEITCSRKRAWEKIEMGSLTQNGQEHKIIYYNPGVDPTARNICTPIGAADTCIEKSAIEFCSRLYPKIPNCENDITLHMARELEKFEERRIDSKDAYKKLGLEMDARTHELYNRLVTLVRKYGQNISPFKRIDNGTAPMFHSWDKYTNYAYSVRDAFHKVRDEENREWNDSKLLSFFPFLS